MQNSRSFTANVPTAIEKSGIGAQVPTPKKPVTTGQSDDWRLLRLGANSPEEIYRKLEQARSDVAASFAGAITSSFSATDRLCLAIVADSPAALAEKITLAIEQIGKPSAGAVLESHGIFYRSPGVARPRIAFLFPGQASQYAGMLKELVCDLPAASRAMDQADAIMRKNGFQSFAEMAWDADNGAGKDIWITQCSMLLSDKIMMEAILDRGIRPNIVAGHSYGEYVALMAAGAWDFEHAVLATRARCEAIAASRNSSGTMLATNAPASLVEQLSGRLDEPAYVANYNSPEQIVVGGRQEPIADLAEMLQREGHQARILAVPCPFHTPLMKEAAVALESTLKSMRIDRPAVPMITAVKNQALSDPDEIRANLVAHMSMPIHFDQMIRTIADQAPTVFIEVGPQQVLTRLVRRILGQDSTDAIACDNPKRPGIEQLWHVQALLECTGAWSPVSEIAAKAPSTMQQRAGKAESPAEVLVFDATALRREKMRQAADGQAITTTGAPDYRIALPTGSGRTSTTDSNSHHWEQPANGSSIAVASKSSRISSPAPSQNAAPVAMKSNTPKDADLEKFLIHFVVEHTGYPEEVVELDADLEADLGIDSIKKAQLFGELREYFDITPDANLTLDDFPTLRHVLSYLRGDAPDGTTTTVAQQEQSVEQPANPTFSTDLDDTRQRYNANDLFNGILDGDASTSAASATIGSAPMFSAPLPSAIDPRQTTSNPTTLSNSAAVLDCPAAPGKAPDSSELESFLIRFVVEHTGYPEEVVELDADLEADLGIDSIKKAQLFGELREYFDITPDANLTLDDFPTLRHVLNYLQGKQSAHKEDESVFDAQKTPERRQGPVRTGRLYEIGVARGRAEKQRIRQMLRRCADVAGTEYDQTQFQGGIFKDLYSSFTQDQLEELRGIADGAEVALDNIAAYSLMAHGDSPLLDFKEERPEGDEPRYAEQKSEQSVLSQPTGREHEAEYEPFEELFQNERQTQRFVMRMVDAPFKDDTPPAPKWRGPTLLIGQSALNAAIRRCLEGRGARVLEIAPSGDIDADIRALDDLWNLQPIMHVFMTAARDRQSDDLYDAAAWTQRRNGRLLSPYFLCQRWLQLAGEAELLDQCTLVGMTGLGGDFGFSGLVNTPEGGGIAGLLKGIWIEITFVRGHKKMLIKAIDAPDDEPPDLLAANVVRELAAATMDYEVAFVNGRRRLQTALHQPAELQPRIRIRRGGAWVVTGGARGITARCALELGRRFDLHLHLMGTSPLPRIDPSWANLTDEGLTKLKSSVILQAKQSGEPIAKAWSQVEKALEIDKSLTAFASAGVNATYHSCDVSDRNALARVLDEIRRTDGQIQGIIHGAGIERSTRIERKNRADVEATLDIKVGGARNLMELTRSDPVDYFIGFGSVSGRLGSNGQSDYCMASDLLCKLVSWYRTRRPDCHAVGIHWHGWDEVGMAAKPEVRAMFKRTNAPKLMPVAEGVRHMLREIFAGCAESEVMITDWDCHQRFYKAGAEEEFRNKSDVSVNSESTVQDAQNKVTPAKPLIERISRLDDGALSAEILFQPLRDPFLIEHRMRGKPFLPGVIGMEAIAQAAALWKPQATVIGLQDVVIDNGLSFTADDPITAIVNVVPGKERAMCSLTTELRDRKNRQIESDRLLVRAEVEFAGQAPVLKIEPPGKPPQGWFPYRYPKLNEGIMYHGEPLRCLKECCFQYDGGWGKIVALPLAQLAGPREPNGWILPPAVLDACIVLCGAFAWIQFSASVEVPYSLKKLYIRRQPRAGEICTERFFFRGREDGHSCFDFALFGDDGDVILQAEGYRTVMIGEGDK
jgi:acyl transferase domain-containing protein/NAD(P)-dependent dehydrogenase (short-subunit alcohol dehydrogenase family)